MNLIMMPTPFIMLARKYDVHTKFTSVRIQIAICANSNIIRATVYVSIYITVTYNGITKIKSAY